MSDKHLSTQYDAELSAISNQVLQMGGLAESQVARAVEALTQLKPDLAEDVLIQEARVNQMEMDIDSELSAIIARRQPTARDLRLLVAIAKMIANLERVGDEAARVARTTKTTPKTWPKSPSMWSRAPTCATRVWRAWTRRWSKKFVAPQQKRLAKRKIGLIIRSMLQCSKRLKTATETIRVPISFSLQPHFWSPSC
ncbi:MAG: hypothetical protein EBR46_06900 [Betaproteobacteria bacterium]|nr:hypothetical protein [Betaproteobacteria bacterium]